MDHNMKIMLAMAFMTLIFILAVLLLLPNILIYFMSVLLIIIGFLYWFKLRHVEKSELERLFNRTLHYLHLPVHVQQRASHLLGFAHHDQRAISSSNVVYSRPASVSSPIESRTGRVKSDLNVSAMKFSSPFRSKGHFAEKGLISRPGISQTSFSSPRERSVGVKTCQAVAGPTLASTRFKQNLDYSVYADVNSPGFSERIATYHQESNTEIPGSRYSSPGHFPSVRLLKDHVPQVAMDTRPKGRSTVTVRVAPPLPDYMDSSSTSMLDQTREDTRGESAPTHSVLDALKEISRKRIHGEESESDPKKRHKVDESPMSSADDSGESRMSLLEANCKRGRDEESPETRPQPRKRICSNEIASSFSSTRGKRKIIGAPHLYGSSEEHSLNKKRIFAVFDETAFEPRPSSSPLPAKSGPVSVETNIQITEAPEEETEIQEAKSSTPLRPLFGARVEVEKPSVSPEGARQIFATIQAEETSVSPMACTGRDLREKKLKKFFSALKPKADAPSEVISSAASLTSVTTLTTSIASPVVSTAQHSTSSLTSAKSDVVTESQVLTKPPDLPENKKQPVLTTSAPISEASATQPTSLTFGSGKPTDSLTFSFQPTQTDKKPQTETAPLGKTDTSFISKAVTNSQQTEKKSEPVPPSSSVLPTFGQVSTPSFNFGSLQPTVTLPSSAASKPAPITSSGFGSQTFTIPSTASTTPTFNFGPVVSQAAKITPTLLTSQTLTPAFGTSTNFGAFGAPPVSDTTAVPATASPAFGTVTSTNFVTPSSTTPAFGTPSFGAQSSSNGLAIPSTAFGNVTSSNFGTPSSTSTAFGTSTFGVQSSSNAPVIPTTAATTFGTPTAASNTFGTPTVPSNTFGTPATPSNTFGTPSSTSTAFGTPTVPSSNTFGTPSVPSNTFGTPSSTSTAFATPSFGAATTNFGSPFASSTSNVTTAPPAFASTTAPLPSFGTQFGTPTRAQFGTVSTTTPSAPPAYGSQTPGSVASPPPAYGQTTTSSVSAPPPAYGAPNAAVKPFMFGNQTSSPAFPAPVSSTTTSFQTTTSSKPAFGGTFQFGGSTPSSSGFGSDNKTTSNPFGAPPNQSPFQQQETTGAPSSSSAGGFAYQASATSTAPKPFAFGTTKPPENQMFGGAAKSTAPQPFSFAGPNSSQQQGFAGTNPTPTQGFGGPSTAQTQAFAGSNTSQQQGFKFGGSSQPSTQSFGADSSTFSFGQGLNNPSLSLGAPPAYPQPAGGGMFSIGAGATRSRPGVTRRRKPN